MDIPKKFCHNCGHQVLAGAKFCGDCGTSLASLDAKPPVAQQPTAPQKKSESTFTPFAGNGGTEDDKDWDDREIRADRVESLAELRINMDNIDISVDMPRTFKETVGMVAAQGATMPQGYKESPRNVQTIDPAEVIRQIQKEGGTLRKGDSTEIN